MCIRDRFFKNLLYLNGFAATLAPDSNLLAEIEPAFVYFMGCLLYTSDAADDLLCVDLGGRRIIKKKKKSE